MINTLLNDQLKKSLDFIQQTSNIKYQYNKRKLVFERDKLKLYHYTPKQKKPHSTPLLVVFATVNRPEILDLFPEHSFIGNLLNEGMDTYLLDWGYPDANDQEISIDDYVGDYLFQCVKFICKKHDLEKINLLGICQGGLLCLCYAALFQNTINKLVLVSTPIDFHTNDNVIGQILQRIDLKKIQDNSENISGKWLTQFFIYMRPFELIGKKYLRFVDNIHNEELTSKFLHVEKWLNDAPDQTNVSFVELIRNFYQQNKLIKGEIKVNGRKIDLSKLSIPVLNVMAKEDEIVPMSASNSLKKYIGAKYYSEKIYPSGHIGIYVSDKVGSLMPCEISQWLKKPFPQNKKKAIK